MTVQLPFALDEHHRVVSPLTVPREGVYWCLHCHGRVRVQRYQAGKHRQVFPAHFQHLNNQACEAPPQVVLLEAARRKLKHRLLADLQNTGGVVLSRPCRGFQGNCRHQEAVEDPLPLPGWSEVMEDLRLYHDGFLHRLDGAVLQDGQLALAFVLQENPAHPLPPLPCPVLQVRTQDLLEDKPLRPVGSGPSGVLCADCQVQQQRSVADQLEESHALEENSTNLWSRVAQRWNTLTSKKAIEQLTAHQEKSPRERAVQVLKKVGLNYRDLKDLRLVTLLVPCPACQEEVVFATAKPEVVRKLKDHLGPLVTWVKGQRRHVHVCSHCGAQHTEEWFWEAWSQHLGERV